MDEYEHVLQFYEFGQLLENKDINSAKKLVTAKNVRARNPAGWGIVVHVCWFGPDTDEGLDLLHYVLNLGASLDLKAEGKRWSPLHSAAWHGKPKLARELVRLGLPVDIKNTNSETPLCLALANNQNIVAKVLLDCGANLELIRKDEPFFKKEIPLWFNTFVLTRNERRQASIAILGLLRCNSEVLKPNGKDILQIIAKSVWGTRGHEV